MPLYAKGLTTGEIAAHFAEIYGASVSKETVSRITDKVIEEMQSWQNRPLDEIYAALVGVIENSAGVAGVAAGIAALRERAARARFCGPWNVRAPPAIVGSWRGSGDLQT